jgi:hypothetical protein
LEVETRRIEGKKFTKLISINGWVQCCTSVILGYAGKLK